MLMRAKEDLNFNGQIDGRAAESLSLSGSNKRLLIYGLPQDLLHLQANESTALIDEQK